MYPYYLRWRLDYCGPQCYRNRNRGFRARDQIDAHERTANHQSSCRHDCASRTTLRENTGRTTATARPSRKPFAPGVAGNPGAKTSNHSCIRSSCHRRYGNRSTVPYPGSADAGQDRGRSGSSANRYAGRRVWLDQGLTRSQPFPYCATAPDLAYRSQRRTHRRRWAELRNNSEIMSMRSLRRCVPLSAGSVGLEPRCIRQSNVYIKQKKLRSRPSRIL
ncbi:hypothetical protein DR64_7977 [Paraburkholderia xenovorans LB400]|nr:hypothetical protein DR64_7977 [Paraburkholderia xenovorans LB400]